MTNYEKYMYEIIDYLERYHGVDKQTGFLRPCDDMECEDCKLHNPGGNCHNAISDFLTKEAGEQE